MIREKIASWLMRGRSTPRAATTSLRSPALWFMEGMFGRHKTAAGIDVSETTALSISAYYCGINMIAGTIGSLPLNVYRRTLDGKRREVADTHPAHWLLHNEPNSEMTAMSFRQTLMVHALARGNGYAEIEWDNRGYPARLWLLPPHMTRPVRDDTGQLWYEVTVYDKTTHDPKMETRYLKPADVLHVPGLGYDGVMGYGLIRVAAESIGLSAAQEQYAAKFFKNGGSISGALTTDQKLGDVQFQRLKSEIANKLSGLSNAHRIALFEQGLKYEAQLIESRRFTADEWARWLNIPPHKLKELTHATFSNIEEQNIEFVVDTIRPWLVRCEQEYNRKLFVKKGVFYTKHVVEGLLRGNIQTRYAAYGVGRQWGWLCVDDVRELEDMNPLPDNQGQQYIVPLNMTTPKLLEDKGAASAPPVQPPAAVKAAKRMAGLFAERVLSLEDRIGRDDVFRSNMAKWTGVSAETVDMYCAKSAQINFIAADMNISAEEVWARKKELLVTLIMEGGNNETAD
jgi:HK97 family phage portal protein